MVYEVVRRPDAGSRSRSWSVDAQVAGLRRVSVRLAVLDFPKAMRRALAAALAVLASLFAVPASAAPTASSSYVSEVVRLNAKAWPHAYVRTRPGNSAPFMYALLEPDAGGDYVVHGAGAGAGSTSGGSVAQKVDLSGGARFVVGANGPVSFHVNERYWGVRRIRAGFRWALPDRADRRDTAGVEYREFTRATLPSGRTEASSWRPCRAWTARACGRCARPTSPPALVPDVCLGELSVWDGTPSGGSWVLEGRVVGNPSEWGPYPLMVLDFPRP